jgi:cell division protease FtsH
VPAGIMIAFVALLVFRPVGGGAPTQALSYTSFVGDVTGGKVSTAAITAAGSVSGKLHDGSAYTSQIPTALNDQEVARLLRQAEETATSLLRGHRDTLDRVIGLLLERETINGADLAAIVGTPGPADHQPAAAPLALTVKWHRSG